MCPITINEDTLQSLFPDMVAWRRHLHRHPELSYKEKQTSHYIARQLQQMGCKVRTGVGGYGLVATLQGKLPGPAVALRADIDALPIQDEKKTDYASTVPGVMHACGHDAHTATLLGVAKYYQSNLEQLAGERRLLFQPAEEVCPGGALPMIADGALEGVDAIYGVHLWTPLPYGIIASRAGAFMAAPDEFTIEIIGRGGHGGLPHQTVDAIIVGSALVQALQTIVSRNVNPLHPAVLSIGAFHAGSTANIIAERALLKGTVRTFDESTKQLIRRRIQEMAEHTCTLYGAQSKVDYKDGYPPVINDAAEYERFKRVGALLSGCEVQQSELIMAGEDFSYYLQHVKGCFMFVGAGNADADITYPHHHPRFDIEERAMASSARLLIAMAEDVAVS